MFLGGRVSVRDRIRVRDFKSVRGRLSVRYIVSVVLGGIAFDHRVLRVNSAAVGVRRLTRIV